MGVFSSMWKVADQAKKGWKTGGKRSKRRKRGSRKRR